MAAIRLEDDHFCFVCGQDNPQGLKLKFQIDAQNQISSAFTPQKIHQGFSGIVHGGLIAAVLDEVMVNLLWLRKIPAVSAELNVRLKKPAKIGERLNFKAWVVRQDKRIIYTQSQAYKDDGSIIATACAKCVRMS